MSTMNNSGNGHRSRTFIATPAKRTKVPLLIGLFGPSGSGKTFTSLRLATGIAEAFGGDICLIDTEAGRALHYADRFKFQHVPFDAPFGSLDYLQVIRQCVGAGASVTIIDSASHEHEGAGGYLQTHDSEVERLSYGDTSKRGAVNMLAWAKPSSQRRQLINGIVQLNANLIWCFRAKEKVKPERRGGRTEVVEQGFMPISGDFGRGAVVGSNPLAAARDIAEVEREMAAAAERGSESLRAYWNMLAPAEQSELKSLLDTTYKPIGDGSGRRRNRLRPKRKMAGGLARSIYSSARAWHFFRGAGGGCGSLSAEATTQRPNSRGARAKSRVHRGRTGPPS
jgi:hypothetical protein